jgi:endonuclease III
MQASGNDLGARGSQPSAALEAGEGRSGAGLRSSGGLRRWGRRLAGGPGGLPHQAHQVEGQREGIADEHGLGGVGQKTARVSLFYAIGMTTLRNKSKGGKN